MQNFTKEESSALLYLKLARDLGAANTGINKSTCEVIVNLVERLMKEKEDLKTHNKILSQKRVNMYERLEIYQQAKKRVREELLSEIKETDGIGNWISVKDRLPNTKEHNKEYLCRCVLLDDETEEYAYCLVLKWYLYDIIDGETTIGPHFEEDGHNMKVTHWQPLPEMPKIEGDKNEQQ